MILILIWVEISLTLILIGDGILITLILMRDERQIPLH
jgi:hypothetical protein